eukprot:2402398-Pleurochrysis_carterae.AAC.1
MKETHVLDAAATHVWRCGDACLTLRGHMLDARLDRLDRAEVVVAICELGHDAGGGALSQRVRWARRRRRGGGRAQGGGGGGGSC